MVSGETRWVLIEGHEVSVAGAARVNGNGGFSYELRGVAVDSAPDSISLQVWGPVPSPRPHYAGFGVLEEGSLEVLTAPERGRHWLQPTRSGSHDWDTIFRGYRATVDWPAAAFWRELVERRLARDAAASSAK